MQVVGHHRGYSSVSAFDTEGGHTSNFLFWARIHPGIFYYVGMVWYVCETRTCNDKKVGIYLLYAGHSMLDHYEELFSRGDL